MQLLHLAADSSGGSGGRREETERRQETKSRGEGRRRGEREEGRDRERGKTGEGQKKGEAEGQLIAVILLIYSSYKEN